jgi:CRISPR/Cas system-associated protein Csm6
MELRMQVEDQFLENLMRFLGLTRATDVVREALTLLNWAVQERRKGRYIVSTDANGRNTARLVMPSLERVPTAETEGVRASSA